MATRVGGGGYAESRGGGVGDGTGGGRSKNGRDGRDGLGGSRDRKNLKDYPDPSAESFLGDVPSAGAGNPSGISIERTGSIQGRTRGKDDLTAFQAAMEEYEQRPDYIDVIDAVAGPYFNANEPEFDEPDSFRGGTYHTSTNPLGVAGSLIGNIFGGAAGGAVLGQLGSLGPELYHGGGEDGTAADVLGGGTGNGETDPVEDEELDEDGNPKPKPPKRPKPIPFSDIRLADVVSASDYLGL